MGGGFAGARLAAAVSNAGGLGTVGIMAPRAFAHELAEARRMAPDRAIAANLLVPFIRRAHVDACIETRVAVVVLHAGRGAEVVARLRGAGIEVLQTVGTRDEARVALADGATGLVAQGVEAGGHLVGVTDTAATLRDVLDVAAGVPVWAAGGVADAEDVRRLLAAGADAVVAGTRFLLTDECRAHPAYKEALVNAQTTVETQLFGFGWPMRHRVVPNAATRRWQEGPRWVRAINRHSGRLGAVLPLSLMGRSVRKQRGAVPFFSPAHVMEGMPARLVEVTPLYAGESVARMSDVIPAAAAVARLAGH